MGKKDGFTVIELIIVICIVSILSCSIIPSFHLVEKSAIKAAAQEIKMDILYTKNKAVKEGKVHWIKFYQEYNKYIIIYDVFKPHVKDGWLKSNVNLEEALFSTDNYIKFTTKGTTGSGGHIHLRTKHYKVKITVLPGTGRVKIYPIEKI